jgi:hypothetical protein
MQLSPMRAGCSHPLPQPRVLENSLPTIERVVLAFP